MGGRSDQISVLDLRCPPEEWRGSSIKHVSSVAHAKAVGAYGILAAGPRNGMALYDARYVASRRPTGSITENHCRRSAPQDRSSGSGSGASRGAGKWKGKNKIQQDVSMQDGPSTLHPPSHNNSSSLPVVTFPQYKNDAHVNHIGFDVLQATDAGGGYGDHGVVAAAHDDGTVALYSLLDGMRIRSPAVDRIGLGPGGGADGDGYGGFAGFTSGSVVKALQFQTLPGDRHPSLFVGEGSVIKKYSFGTLKGVDEWN